MSKMFAKIKGVMTEVSRSKYMPHYGKKEAAKYAGRAAAARALTIGNPAYYDPETPMPQDDNPGVLSADHRERIGQTVTWISSGKVKTGEIIAVVPSDHLPNDILKDAPQVKDATSRRDHISYVVQVGKVRYWPRVSLLNAVGV